MYYQNNIFIYINEILTYLKKIIKKLDIKIIIFLFIISYAQVTYKEIINAL